VLAAGVILARECPEARGRLRLVFQPAEETGLGAERMIQAGAVEGVDAMFGIHLRPAAECRLGQATPCLVHAGGSGGKPSGVIPEQGELTVNIRAESDEMADELRVRVDTAVKAAAGSVGAGVWLEREKKMPAPCYDPEMIDIARSAIAAVLGDAGVRDRISIPGSEGFHWYARKNFGLRAAYIGLGADFVPGLHHPDATFDRQALVYGAAILAQAAACYFDCAAQV